MAFTGSKVSAESSTYTITGMLSPGHDAPVYVRVIGSPGENIAHVEIYPTENDAKARTNLIARDHFHYGANLSASHITDCTIVYTLTAFPGDSDQSIWEITAFGPKV
jgi:hypothetical protein